MLIVFSCICQYNYLTHSFLIKIMSSTRDSLSATREEMGIFTSMKHQLKESQEMVQDLQKLIAINREAITLFADSNPNAKDAIVENLRAENALLFRALVKSIENQKRADMTVVTV